MTAVPKDPRISELRELFRHLQEFRAVYETTGLEEIETPYGNTWSIWDLEYLYQKAHEHLAHRQYQVISLCLVHNMREKDAAAAMGVSLTNPVMMYATLGIRRLLDLIDSGALPRFRRDPYSPEDFREQQRLKALHALADKIKAQITVVLDDCWAYRPTPPGMVPRVQIRSVYAISGILYVHPMRVTYEAFVRPIPASFQLFHKPGKQHLACVNPAHGLINRRHNMRSVAV